MDADVSTPAMRRRDDKRRAAAAGFTLVEVVVAGCLLAVLIAGSLAALTQINRWATSARLRTLALAVAQQRIDAVQTTPWQPGAARAAILTAGTATETNLPLNNDAFNSATGLSSAFTNLDAQTNVTRTTVVTDVTTRTLRAVVTVTFTYRNRPHAVTLTTLRATDSI
jgi:type II secretory pathway pseudopilin PulG